MDDVAVVGAMIDEGTDLETVETYLDRRTDLDPDARDALALYAWARQDRGWKAELGEAPRISPGGD